MKAKDYAVRFDGNPNSPDVALSIVKDLEKEAQALIKDRRCSTVEATNSVYMEMDRKWRAIARLTPGLNPDAFNGQSRCTRAVKKTEED